MSSSKEIFLGTAPDLPLEWDKKSVSLHKNLWSMNYILRGSRISSEI